jgi:hypothetical protein
MKLYGRGGNGYRLRKWRDRRVREMQWKCQNWIKYDRRCNKTHIFCGYRFGENKL